MITELEEFIPKAYNPLKKVRKIATESTSDALIDYRTYKSKSRSPIVSQGSYELEGFLMAIDAIEKHLMGSRDTVHDFLRFTPPSFTVRVS